MQVVAGIDAGSRAIKIVLAEAGSGRVLDRDACDQGPRQAELAAELLERMLERRGLASAGLRRVVATGYGRSAIARADATVTEITCQARGVHAVAPAVRTVIDIGGQDSKLIRLGPSGRMVDFVMNDRCAAGTGRFLEVVSVRLGLPLEALGRAGAGVAAAVSISSMCVVFAETEIVSLLAAGEAPEAIAAGVRAAIATRVAAMAGRTVEPPVVLTGGVARLDGMADALAEALGTAVEVASQPRFTGALGAALLAAERA